MRCLDAVFSHEVPTSVRMDPSSSQQCPLIGGWIDIPAEQWEMGTSRPHLVQRTRRLHVWPADLVW